MWSNPTFSSQLLLGQMCACWFDRCPIALLDVLDLIVASSCVVQRLQTSIRQSNFAPRVFLFTICRATRTNIEKGISELTQSKFVFDKVDRRNPLFYSCSRICFQITVILFDNNRGCVSMRSTNKKLRLLGVDACRSYWTFLQAYEDYWNRSGFVRGHAFGRIFDRS